MQWKLSFPKISVPETQILLPSAGTGETTRPQLSPVLSRSRVKKSSYKNSATSQLRFVLELRLSESMGGDVGPPPYSSIWVSRSSDSLDWGGPSRDVSVQTIGYRLVLFHS